MSACLQSAGYHRCPVATPALLPGRAETPVPRPECDGDPMTARIAPVFLSASEPNPERDPSYWETRNVVNLREAVRAFCAHVLPNFPLVLGGHPAITPLVRGAAQRIAYDLGLDAESAEK